MKPKKHVFYEINCWEPSAWWCPKLKSWLLNRDFSYGTLHSSFTARNKKQMHKVLRKLFTLLDSYGIKGEITTSKFFRKNGKRMIKDTEWFKK